MSVMDSNQTIEKLITGGILVMARRCPPRSCGRFQQLSPPQREKLGQKCIEFASPLSHYDTLEFHYGDQNLILYKIPVHLLVLTYNSPKLSPQILETLLPTLQNFLT
ncbi:MAG: hypothetical protein ACK421_02395 [Pseudanabaenaceae cyanobacterium]